MLDKLILYSIKNKLVIGLLILGLIGVGGYSLTQLPIDAVPDITNNQVQIITLAPSLAAQEIERMITAPVEVSMKTIPEIVEMRSFSRFGLSVVTIVFKETTDVYWARQQVNERLNLAKEMIPAGAGSPTLAPVTTGLGEIYQYVIRAKKGYEHQYNATDLRTIQDWTVRRALLGTEGVADVSAFGGFLKQYEIAIDPQLLRSMNLTIHDVFLAVNKSNQNTGGAYISKEHTSYFIRTEGLAKNLADIEQIVVSNTPAGTPILVKNIGKVQIGHAIRYGAATSNADGEVVAAVVMMLKGENSAKVIKNVKVKIEEIKTSLPKGVEIVPFLDRTKLVDNAIHTVSKNLMEGALIVIFVLVLILGNLRAGLIVASVIPLAMLFAFWMMYLFGVSGNLMSLGAIDFGLIVDGAVIIVEATMHHLLSSKRGCILTQSQMDDEVYISASKIRNSAAFGEIIILIVYLPILALGGTEGKMFKPMAETVVFAIAGAFLLSLTYVPMATSLFLSKKISDKITLSDKIILWFQDFYKPVLLMALRRKILVVIVSLVLLVGSVFVFNSLGGEFIPTLEEGDFAVETRVLIGSSLEETISATQKAAKIIKTFPEVKEVIAKIGSGEIPTDPMPIEAADLMIVLKDKDEWTSATNREELAEKMSQALDQIPGVTFSFQQPIQMRFNELMTGAKQDVAIKIYGEQLEELSYQAQAVGALAQRVDGVSDLYVEKISGLPQIVIKINSEKLAKFGLQTETVNQTVQMAFAGMTTGLVYEGEKRFDLVIRLQQSNRQNIQDVKKIFVTGANGIQIPLEQVADILIEAGPNQIQRDEGRRRITVAFNVRGQDVETVVNNLQSLVNKEIDFKPGYYITYGGQFQNLIDAKARLSIALPIALVLIFALLYFTFNSVAQSLLIFASIPLSAIGGILILWLRGMPFSISAGVGFIALFGVSVLNGIVLMAEFNRLRKDGIIDLQEVVVQGTMVRLRPVLMTALVASLGFLPMALSGGSGSEVQKPLATVVIGGLISATLLTLIVLPVLYVLVEYKVTKNIK